jgi:hypothetical protein
MSSTPHPTLTTTSLLRRFFAGGVALAMPVTSPRPLAAFRIGVASVLILQALAIGPNLHDLYGQDGIVPWSEVERLFPDAVPRLSWLAGALAPLGVSPASALRLAFGGYALALACLLLGWRTRAAAFAAWLIHLAMNVSGHASIYGVDEFANIALFYCLCLPVGAAWSLDARRAPQRSEPAPEYGLALRVPQVHLCIVYTTSGMAKAQGIDWWTGQAMWCALMQPDSWCDFSWLSAVPWLATLAGWGTLLVEIGYGVGIWLRTTRLAWLGAIVSMHLGIAIFLGLVSFAALMIAFNLAAFALPLLERRPDSTGGVADRERGHRDPPP